MPLASGAIGRYALEPWFVKAEGQYHRAMKTCRSSAMILAGALALVAPGLRAQDVTEPGSGVKFAAHEGETSLLGIGLRTKTFLKVKVYAIGLYVADTALTGPLAAYKGKAAAPAFYQALVLGDFPKEVRLRFVRDLSAESDPGGHAGSPRSGRQDAGRPVRGVLPRHQVGG